MKNHPIAAGIWLLLALGGIGYAASGGMSASAEARKAEKAKELNAKLAEVILKGRRGDYDGAIAGFEQLIALYPDVSGLYFNLGVAQRAKGALDEADRTFQKVLELDPKDYDAIAERATIQLEQGKTDQAISLLESIPENEGRLRERLRDDPAWVELSSDSRVAALRKKHGVDGFDHSLHIQRMQQMGAPQGVHVP